MKGYLSHLVAGLDPAAPVIRPRLPGIFEPLPPATWAPLETEPPEVPVMTAEERRTGAAEADELAPEDGPRADTAARAPSPVSTAEAVRPEEKLPVAPPSVTPDKSPRSRRRSSTADVARAPDGPTPAASPSDPGSSTGLRPRRATEDSPPAPPASQVRTREPALASPEPLRLARAEPLGGAPAEPEPAAPIRRRRRREPQIRPEPDPPQPASGPAASVPALPLHELTAPAVKTHEPAAADEPPFEVAPPRPVTPTRTRRAVRAAPPPRPAPTPAAEPTVHVTIGRVEVRSVAPPVAPPQRRRQVPAAIRLEEYLKRHAGGGS